MSLPGTAYIWLVLLILAFIAPAAVPVEERHVSGGKETMLTATEFADMASAETQVRSAFGIDALRRKLSALTNSSGLGSLGGLAGVQNQKQRDQFLDEAAKTFRDLEKSQHTPGLVRRVFVIEHALGKRLDESLVSKDLPEALKQTKVTPEGIAAEQRFWRSLYGSPPSVTRADVPSFDRLVRDMKLPFLQNRVLYDLYTAAGDTKRAAVYEAAFDQETLRSMGAELAISSYILVVFVAGLVFLLLFAAAARSGNWRIVKRIATRSQILGWGDLLDAFLFYLALLKGVNLCVGLLAARFSHAPKPSTALVLDASVYVATGLAAVGYLAWTIRRRGATFADIGLRAPRGILPEMVYGCAGYCAALPIVAVLGELSHFIFRHDQTRTPNPILPLIAVEHDPVGKIVILLLVSVGAPLFEELFFRGVFFSGLRTRFSWVPSAAISGIVFASLHPMQDWLPIFGLGFALATMREMRQSLVPGMTAHLLQNTLAFITMSVLFSS